MLYRFTSVDVKDYDAGFYTAIMDQTGEYVWNGVEESGRYKTVAYKSYSTDTRVRCSRRIGSGFRCIVVEGFQRESVERQLKRFGIEFDKKRITQTPD